MSADIIKVSIPQIGEEEVIAVREVLLSGSYVSGSKVKEFEEQFADYVGTKHAIAVNSGTSALHIALEALGIREGDEVIVPPLTFFATISSVLYLRAIPVFADIDLDDFCLSPKSVEEHISSKTKAFLPVHLFGASAKMDDFLSLSKRHGIPILEDCAQAHGTEYNGRRVGSIGSAGAFSFFATKHMTTGEGGMITTDDHKVADICGIIRNHGMSSRNDHERLGFNNRMTEMEAAIGLVQLSKLEDLNSKRIINSEYLLKHIRSIPWAKVPVPEGKMRHTYFWCPLMIDEEIGNKDIEELKDHLTINKIEFRHRYHEPLYRQGVLKRVGLDYSGIYLPNAERATGKVIGLPNHPGLTENELDRIIDVLHKF